ncbi:MAG: hypothetical protein NC079_01175 [Clostridium sp.]|nr:hypothetical protein [Acetatifactor muris]MCM1526040.1 hypothetical protein [Bacteroides sp.]MCM1562200.1 hypothetical protein [Clostridium sp.]
MALLCVIPSLELLLIQNQFVSSKTELLDVSIQFGSYMGLDLLQVITASLMAFPVVILCFRASALRDDPAYFIAIAALVIGWIQMFFVKDEHGNFSWGYDLAVQFAVLVTLAVSRRDVNPGRRKYINYAAYGIFAWQIVTGLSYLHDMYTTTSYKL